MQSKKRSYQKYEYSPVNKKENSYVIDRYLRRVGRKKKNYYFTINFFHKFKNLFALTKIISAELAVKEPYRKRNPSNLLSKTIISIRRDNGG